MRLALLLIVLVGCAPVQAPQVRPKVGVFLVPLDALDSDLVCAETPIYVKFHDCLTVKEFRSLANSQRAEP
jgi:hypothetical protein